MKNILKALKWLIGWLAFLIVTPIMVLFGFIVSTVLGIICTIVGFGFVVYWPILAIKYKLKGEQMQQKWRKIWACCLMYIPFMWATIMPEVLISAGWKKEEYEDNCGCSGYTC